MEKIKIITDSTADLSKDIVEKYHIEVIPLMVHFGEEAYYDGLDMDFHSLISKMKETDMFPTTTQINPQRFYDYYKKYINEGYKVLSIHLSSKMSGTYQSGCIAKDMLNTDDIVVIDSQNVTSGLGVLVMYGARLIEKGYSLHEIENEIKNSLSKVKSMLAFNSLEHLVKGGRLSKTAGFIGNVLGIKPMLCVKNGEMAVVDKVRGNKKALKTILDYLDNMNVKEGTPVILLEAEEKDMKEALREKLTEKKVEVIEQEVGCIVGTHSGPEACGIFFIEQ